MAEDVMVKDAASNSCCITWKEKYTKLKERHAKSEEGRNALRQALSILDQQLIKSQADNAALKKACEDEEVRANSERELKEKESTMRVALENEVDALKIEIQMLQQNCSSSSQNSDVEIQHLEEKISDGEKEISHLKQLLEKESLRADEEKKRADAEKKRANAEKRRAETERKKADEALKKLKADKDLIQEDKRLADVERKKYEENRVQLEVLKNEIVQVKSDVEETKKKLDSERSKLSKEKKRADLAVFKAEEQSKLAETNRKKAMDEKCRADTLSKQLEKGREKILELEKNISELVSFKKSVEVSADLQDKQIYAGNAEVIYDHGAVKTKGAGIELELGAGCLNLEGAQSKVLKSGQEIIPQRKQVNSEVSKADRQKKVAKAKKKRCAEDKHRIGKLYQEVESNKHMIREMQSLIEKHVSSETFVKPSLSTKTSESESAKIRTLQKKLKFEKMLVKHAKQVAELEVARNNILQHELCRLKQEILQLSHHLNILDNPAFRSGEGIRELEKLHNIHSKRQHFHEESRSMHLSDQGLLSPNSTGGSSVDVSHPKQSLKYVAPFLPSIGGSHTETIAGINSKLEHPHRSSIQKKLQSSAINSSSASFSDRPLVGSQEEGALSVSTSTNYDEENLEQSAPKINNDSTKGCSSSLAAVSGSRIKSHTHAVAQGKTGKDYREQEYLSPVESSGYLFTNVGKCHQPVANGQPVQTLPEKRSSIPGLQRTSCDDDARSSKRRKISCEEHVVPKSILRSSSTEDFGLCKQAPHCGSIPAEGIQVQDDEINDYFINPDLSGRLYGMGGFDYMKLLDLDNADEEMAFCAAMDRPLSPTLPVLEFRISETPDVCGIRDIIDNSFHAGRVNVQENALKRGSFDVSEIEIDSNNMSKSNGHGSPTRVQLEEPNGVSPLRNLVDSQMSDFHSNHESGSEQRLHDMAAVVMESSSPCKSEVTLLYRNLPIYLVVFTDIKEIASISRIFGAVGNCMSRCSMLPAKNVIREILTTLTKSDGLSSKEKACAFVSTLLQNISKAMSRDIGETLDRDFCQFIDSCSCDLIADVDVKKILLQLGDPYDLLNLVEDFLSKRKALVYGGESSESVDTFFLDGHGAKLTAQEAPSNLLNAGAALLASICASVDHIGFACEASCRILRTQFSDSSFVLTILHVFARICGANFFSVEYGMSMTVIRSLVVHLERLKSSDCHASCFPSSVEAPSKPWSCSNCPFLDGAASIDAVVSLLLEELRGYIISVVEKQNVEQVNLLEGGALMCEVDCWKAFPTKELPHKNFLCLVDILSLVELLASFMCWDWSFENIVCPILSMLESCTVECFFAALITLLGQIGRFGVEAHGYEDTKVDNLRGQLSALLIQSTNKKLGFLLQLACAAALISLTPLSFEELVVDNHAKIPETAAGLKSWFSSLSDEQQSSCKIELFFSTPSD